MSSSRERLAEIIEPMLPPAWARKIETHTVKTIGTLSADAVFIDYLTMDHAGMPAGQLLDGFEVALVSRLTDYEKAEDALDPVAQSFVRALDQSSDVIWTGARKAGLGGQNNDAYLGWIFTVQMLNTTT